MTWPSPSVPLPTDQTNATVQFDNHPIDHATTNQVINDDIVPKINEIEARSTFILGQAFAVVGDVTASGLIDVLTFSYTARTDAVYAIEVDFNDLFYNPGGSNYMELQYTNVSDVVIDKAVQTFVSPEWAPFRLRTFEEDLSGAQDRKIRLNKISAGLCQFKTMNFTIIEYTKLPAP